jgi:transposase
MTKRSDPEIVELDSEQLESLLSRMEEGQLTAEDVETLRAALQSYLYVTQLIDQKSTTIARLRKLLFGAETEKTAAVTGRPAESPWTAGTTELGSPGEAGGGGAKKPREKPKGHGRNGADDYPGATRVPHETLGAGDPCPSCERGTLYGQPRGGIVLRFTGQPPVQVTVYELEKLRCGLCGEVFTAQLPEAAGLDKYDPTVASMIVLLKYGNGLPFNRLDGLQENLGMPLPSSTQWDIVAEAYPQIQPVYE